MFQGIYPSLAKSWSPAGIPKRQGRWKLRLRVRQKAGYLYPHSRFSMTRSALAESAQTSCPETSKLTQNKLSGPSHIIHVNAQGHEKTCVEVILTLNRKQTRMHPVHYNN